MVNTLSKYLNRLDEAVGKDRRHKLLFRGQADENWSLESSAVRRIKSNTNESEVNQGDFVKYHEVLVQKARKNLSRNAPETQNGESDLALLAEIQHFGGATCLTDFTTNYLIALWFASSKALDKNKNEINGKVFVVNLLSHDNTNVIHEIDCYPAIKEKDTPNINKPISELLKALRKRPTLKTNNVFYAWQPSRINRRIHHQESFFLFGLPALPESSFHTIVVEQEDKIDLRNQLKRYFDIDVENIFPDFQGFASDANGQLAPFNDLYCKNCLEISYEFLIEGNRIQHEKYKTKAIVCYDKKDRSCSRNNEVCSKEKNIDFLWHMAEYKRKSSNSVAAVLEAIEDYRSLQIRDPERKEDCLYWIADLSYDIGKFKTEKDDYTHFADAIDCYEELLRDYNLEHDYDFCNIAILELSIFSNNKSKFQSRYERLESTDGIPSDNFNFLKMLFHDIAESFFYNKMICLNKIIEKLRALKVDKNIRDDFIWSFDDLYSWGTREYSDQYDDWKTFTTELEQMQKAWKDLSYEERLL